MKDLIIIAAMLLGACSASRVSQVPDQQFATSPTLMDESTVQQGKKVPPKKDPKAEQDVIEERRNDFMLRATALADVVSEKTNDKVKVGKVLWAVEPTADRDGVILVLTAEKNGTTATVFIFITDHWEVLPIDFR